MCEAKALALTPQQTVLSELFDTGKKSYHKIFHQFGNFSFNDHAVKSLEERLMADSFSFLCVLFVLSAIIMLKQIASFLGFEKKF